MAGSVWIIGAKKTHSSTLVNKEKIGFASILKSLMQLLSKITMPARHWHYPGSAAATPIGGQPGQFHALLMADLKVR